MNLEKELVLKLNELAEYLVKNGIVVEHKDLTELERKAIRFFKENELIKSSPNRRLQYLSTPEINKIAELGIEKYLSNKDSTEKLETEIQRLTIINLKLENRQLRLFVIYSIISFIAGGIITNLKDILILLNLVNP